MLDTCPAAAFDVEAFYVLALVGPCFAYLSALLQNSQSQVIR